MVICIYTLGGQTCTDSIDVQQNGNNDIGRSRLAIFPRLNFTCDGRITGIMAKVRRDNRIDFPYFQIWRLVSARLYSYIDGVQVQGNQVSSPCNNNNFCNVDIVLTGNDRITFQSGDIVGYFQPNQNGYRVRSTSTQGYTLYRFDGSVAPTLVNLSRADRTNNERQPLIQFVIGMYIMNSRTYSVLKVTVT